MGYIRSSVAFGGRPCGVEEVLSSRHYQNRSQNKGNGSRRQFCFHTSNLRCRFGIWNKNLQIDICSDKMLLYLPMFEPFTIEQQDRIAGYRRAWFIFHYL